MIEISVAVAFVGLLAWDIARRKVTSPAAERITQAEHNLQEVAVDVLAVKDDLAKTDRVIHNLALDWQAKFAQLDAAIPKVEKDVMTKVGGALANLPSKGYHR